MTVPLPVRECPPPLTRRELARKFAREYAQARAWRRDAVRQGWFNTAFSLRGYIAVLRRCWAAERRGV